MIGSAHILYFNKRANCDIQERTLAGIRRYAAARDWEVVSVPEDESRPERIRKILDAYSPIVGCVVENSDDARLPPRVFGGLPTVHLHAAPSLYGGRAARIATDNEAVAHAAFRELSACRPSSFAVVDYTERRAWARIRLRVFRELCAEAGMSCAVFLRRNETRVEKIARLEPWLAALPRRCAIFAVNDYSAEEVVIAAQAAGRSIPRDLSLLGVDNEVARCEARRPTISSIQLDFERAGFLAARFLAARMTDRAPSLSDSEPVASVGPLLAVRRESTRGSGRREPRILEAVEMIRREACEGLTAAQLITRFPGSRWLFEKRFREAMGHSVLDEILHVRLERAFTLLSQTDTPIGAIADFCGFRSYWAVDALFRSRFGMSMGEWRRKNRWS